MIKFIKSKWQSYWDGNTEPMFQDDKPQAQAPAMHSIAGAPDPYMQLTALGHRSVPALRTYELEDPNNAEPVPQLAAPAQREYEADLPQWAREALAEMDAFVGVVVREELTEVRTPQFVRRTRRNLTETIGDVALLEAEDGADQLLERILSRARRASDTDITGLIPVVQADAAEEAWA